MPSRVAPCYRTHAFFYAVMSRTLVVTFAFMHVGHAWGHASGIALHYAWVLARINAWCNEFWSTSAQLAWCDEVVTLTTTSATTEDYLPYHDLNRNLPRMFQDHFCDEAGTSTGASRMRSGVLSTVFSSIRGQRRRISATAASRPQEA